MGYLPGENINLGLGKESTRGTAVSPTLWLAGRTPSGLNVVNDKTLIQETKGTRSASKGSVITEQRAEGDIEFNVKNTTIVALLRSLLGSVASATASGESAVYDHTVTVDVDEVQAPSYTLALSRPGMQDYEYPLGVISSLELTASPDDLVYATANLMAKSEAEHADYTPSFTGEDYNFPHQKVTVKIANDVAGLSGATGICINELGLSIVNNASVKRCLSSLNPVDVLANLVEISGSLAIDYTGDTYHDIYKDGVYKALEVTIENDDVTIGTSAHPKIVITLPKVSFEGLSEDRPIDGITSESVEFTAHYDDDEAKQIEIVVTNETSSY